MQSINNILVVLDPTYETQPALQKGKYLAKTFGASLELLLVVYSRALITNSLFNPKQIEGAKAHYIEAQSRWVDSYADECKDAGITVSTRVVWHKPLYEAIILNARKSEADLVIKSTHEHQTFNKVFFTPNDWQLLKSCPIPLILAKSETAQSYSKLLAGVDPNKSHGKPDELDPLIVNSAIGLAKATGAECHITHCYSPIEYQLWSDIGMGMGVGMGPTDFSMGENSYSEYVTELKNNLQEKFNALVHDYDFNQSQLHLEEGYPEQLLPAMVDKMGVDLIVLGTQYHSGLVGSTAEKILDEVNCDILSVNLPIG